MKSTNLVPSIIEQLSAKFKNKDINSLELNMFDIFWLMHGNFTKLPRKEVDFDSIIKKALYYYEDQFKIQTENFILEIFDDVYINIDKYNQEAKYIDEDLTIIKSFKELLITVRTWKDNYVKYSEDYAPILKNIEVPWSPKKTQNKGNQEFRPSKFIKLKKQMDNKRTVNISPKYEELYQKQRKDKKRLTILYNKTRKIILQVLEYSDDNFKYMRNVLNSNTVHFERLIIILEYALSTNINYEMLSLYLFISHDKKDSTCTKILSNKQENFIKDLYAVIISFNSDLKKLFNFQFNATVSEIKKEYLYPPKQYNTPITFFQIHKIIILYSALIPSCILDINHSNRPHEYSQKVKTIVNYYSYIFDNTAIPYPCYDFFLSTPPFKIFDILGMDRKQIASILSLTPSALSKQINTGTFVDKHRWFFLALSGCTHEFLDSLTSIPLYGTDAKIYSDYQYTIPLAYTVGIAENMMRNIYKLYTYRGELNRDNNSSKFYTFSSVQQEEITALIRELINLIHQKREFIEKESNPHKEDDLMKFKGKKTSAIGNQYQNHEENPPHTSVHFEQLKSILKDTINTLKLYTKDKN